MTTFWQVKITGSDEACIRPSAYSLCLQDEENTQHLMVSCEITQQIWKEVCGLLKLTGNWNLVSLEDNLLNWFLVFLKHRSVPLLVSWGIWRYRNKILFENFSRNDSELCLRIVKVVKEFPYSSEGDTFDFILSPTYFGDRRIGFFDGATAGGDCGIGVFLKLSQVHFLKIHLNVGSGTNVKA